MKNLERHLATVLCADVKEYSRHMGLNEEATIHRLGECRAAFDALIVEHGGRIANTAGDSVVSEFSGVSNAVTCAVKIQEKMKALGEDHSSERLIYRLGIHLGEVVAKGQDILGDTVNIAARLEGLADADGICISAAVYDAVRNKLPYRFDPMGDRQLKNIDEPVKVFKVLPEQEVASSSLPDSAFPALPDKPSIAVLPLDNMSSDPEQEYFSDGLTEDIITDLSKVSGLFVISRTSSFSYKKQTVDLRRVGAELGVKYVLEGSVRKGGDRVRISVQLIEVDTGNHIWAERYDRVLTDIFDVQDEITRTVVEALEVKLTKREQALIQERGTDNLKAYDLFIRGREAYYRYSKDAVAEARLLLHEAIKTDPAYALAYVFVAHTHIYDYLAGYVPARMENLGLAYPFAKKAIELDKNCANAYAALGRYYIWHRQETEGTWHRQAEEGIAQLLKAIELEPSNDYAYAWLSISYSATEQGEKAIHAANQALRLNPSHSVVTMLSLGFAQFQTGEMEASIQSFLRAISINPDFLPPHVFLVVIYTMTGQHEEAEHHAQEIRRLSPRFTLGMCNFYSPETVAYRQFNDALASLGFSGTSGT
jgi:adenylate cyclase